MKRKALAQIPLILGLFVMAVAIPVATKLVQQNQDTRNKAASVTCGSSGTISQCGSKGGCATGYRCLPNGCSYDPACGGFVPTNTPKPPTATPKPPTATQSPSGCNSVYETRKCVNAAEYTCTNNIWVKTKDCTGPCVNNACPVAPYSCNGPNGVSGLCRSPCLTNEIDTGQSNCASPGIRCCIPKPTATPTTKPCSKTGGACNSQGDCCSGNVCWNGHCYISSGPSSTPTKKPTATPTLTCKATGANCSTGGVPCCSGKCSDGKCVVNPSVTPTCNDPCDVGDTGAIRCKSNKQQRCENRCWTFMKDCPNGCDGNYCRVTPTKVPTVTPTQKPNPTGMPIVPTTPVPNDKCPGAQACPDSTGKVLRDCKNPDSDGTSRDTICSKAGQKDSCGGKEYCCPSAGGVWTTDMTKCPTSKCTQCSGKPNAKASGDADCSGITNLVDYSIWREEYLSTQCGNHIMILPSWKADFNCDGLVTLADYDIWKNKYLEIFK